jgi:hypothetical protein
MIITKAFVTYRCNHCGISYILKFAPLPPKDIAEVNNSIDKTKQCTVCAGHMDIEQIVFRVVKDLYGDDLYGSWHCPVHSAFIYYPSLMKKAERRQLAISMVSDMAERYRKVVIGKFPWLCPGCGQSMVYKDDRTDTLYR